jgi:hypothetical protein
VVVVVVVVMFVLISSALWWLCMLITKTKHAILVMHFVGPLMVMCPMFMIMIMISFSIILSVTTLVTMLRMMILFGMRTISILFLCQKTKVPALKTECCTYIE